MARWLRAERVMELYEVSDASIYQQRNEPYYKIEDGLAYIDIDTVLAKHKYIQRLFNASAEYYYYFKDLGYTDEAMSKSLHASCGGSQVGWRAFLNKGLWHRVDNRGLFSSTSKGQMVNFVEWAEFMIEELYKRGIRV